MKEQDPTRRSHAPFSISELGKIILQEFSVTTGPKYSRKPQGQLIPLRYIMFPFFLGEYIMFLWSNKHAPEVDYTEEWTNGNGVAKQLA